MKDVDESLEKYDIQHPCSKAWKLQSRLVPRLEALGEIFKECYVKLGVLKRAEDRRVDWWVRDVDRLVLQRRKIEKLQFKCQNMLFAIRDPEKNEDDKGLFYYVIDLEYLREEFRVLKNRNRLVERHGELLAKQLVSVRFDYMISKVNMVMSEIDKLQAKRDNKDKLGKKERIDDDKDLFGFNDIFGREKRRNDEELGLNCVDWEAGYIRSTGIWRDAAGS